MSCALLGMWTSCEKTSLKFSLPFPDCFELSLKKLSGRDEAFKIDLGSINTKNQPRETNKFDLFLHFVFFPFSFSLLELFLNSSKYFRNDNFAAQVKSTSNFKRWIIEQSKARTRTTERLSHAYNLFIDICKFSINILVPIKVEAKRSQKLLRLTKEEAVVDWWKLLFSRRGKGNLN